MIRQAAGMQTDRTNTEGTHMRTISRRRFNGLVVGAAAAGTGLHAHGQEVAIKVADSFPPKHNIANFGTRWWMDRVTELSGGKVKFQYFGAEQLGKLKDMLSLLQAGATDIAYVPPTFFEGKMPLSSVHSLPNLFSTSHVGGLAFYETSMKTAILKEDYQRNGIRPMWGTMTSTYNIFTRTKPIRTVADLKGMKIRSAGGYQDDAVRMLGAVPIDVPSPEAYQAMQLGTVDGAIFPASAAQSYRIHEISKYFTLGFNVTVFYAPYAVNLRSWDRWPADVKAAFEKANAEANLRMGKYFDENNQKLIESYAASGVEIITLPEAEQAKVRQALDPLYAKWAADMKAKNLPGDEVLAYFREAIKRVPAA
jgi:TRAP-type C4-dicarboxylate transport system substrate-binding protein